jgi:predicted O-methyltransferase YrrM
MLDGLHRTLFGIQEDFEMNSLKDDVRLRQVLDLLHARSEAQIPALTAYFQKHGRAGIGGTSRQVTDDRPFWQDKLVALDPIKAEFCYMTCRALGATCAVEAGTSFGVSTLYLAAAIRDNGGGTVIATEYEPQKAKAARAHWEDAGLSALIELREGDLRESLKTLKSPIDFLLMDIWTPMARPALERVAPHMRGGAVIIADNTTMFRSEYGDYFDYLTDPKNGFSTMTLPFEGGLEFSVKSR